MLEREPGMLTSSVSSAVWRGLEKLLSTKVVFFMTLFFNIISLMY